MRVKYLIVYDWIWGVLVTAYKESAQGNGQDLRVLNFIVYANVVSAIGGVMQHTVWQQLESLRVKFSASLTDRHTS